MKNKLRLFFIALLTVVVFACTAAFFGCKKDGNKNPPSTGGGTETPGGGDEDDDKDDPSTPVVEYEDVTTQADFTDPAIADYGSGNKVTSPVTVGRFTFYEGIYVEGESSGLKIEKGNINTQNNPKAMGFELKGVDNKNGISFQAKSASSAEGIKVVLYRVVEGGEDELVKEWVVDGNTLPYGGGYKTDDTSLVLPAGQYYIGSEGGSVRLGDLKIYENVEKSDPASIEVSGANQYFMVGDAFSNSGLTVTLNYENGRTDILTTGYTIDSSDYNSEQSGVYEISVKYGTFTDTYNVYVYKVSALELYDYSVNSSRVTQNVQKVFIKGSQFNADNLAVHAKGVLPEGVTVDKEDKEHDFLLSLNDDYSIAAPADMNSVGAKTVTVSLDEVRLEASQKTDGVKAEYTINVVEDVFSSAKKGTYEITVDINGTVSTSGTVTFKSINDALTYFKLTGVPDTAVKVIKVAPGTYNEKVEIDMPNVSLIGTGTGGSDYKENAQKTVIVFDALNGLTDPSGTTTYSTDGSATISIRASATGFYAENITFKNYYNTNELYNQSKLLTSGTQAVAALVQADMSKFYNVYFTSYHDTLYAQIGRQYYDRCYIEGRTDYIFGYNATAYFTKCELLTIGANDEKNGGYVVSTKGYADDKGTGAIEYGYVFDNCEFTGDKNVVDGTVSLARGWANNMRLVIMNSTISKAYSTEAYGDTSSNKNDRYTAMNAGPVDAKILEYKNTGDGAISATVVGCTVIAESSAEETGFLAKYGSENVIATIYTATNGAQTYTSAWDPTEEQESGSVTGVTISSTLTLEVGKTSKLDAELQGGGTSRLVWYSDDETVATVAQDGTVTAKAVGEVTITVVAVNGEVSATCTVTVEKSSATVTPESWYVSDLIDIADNTQISAGEIINKGTNITVTASDDVKYDSSLTNKQPILPGQSEIVTAGYKTANKVSTGETTLDYIFTANADLKITVYVVLCNDSFNSDRPGTINYSVGGAEASQITGGNRDTVVSVEVVIGAGQSLTINATNNSTSTAQLWLFGYVVEAVS